MDYFFIRNPRWRCRKRKLRKIDRRIYYFSVGTSVVKKVRPKRRKKRTKQKKPGVKAKRVFPKPEAHLGPKYHLSLKEVKTAYSRMRKSNRFYASKKVLWKERHNIVYGCSNFYKKGDFGITYFEEVKEILWNKEYDVP